MFNPRKIGVFVFVLKPLRIWWCPKARQAPGLDDFSAGTVWHEHAAKDRNPQAPVNRTTVIGRPLGPRALCGTIGSFIIALSEAFFAPKRDVSRRRAADGSGLAGGGKRRDVWAEDLLLPEALGLWIAGRSLDLWTVLISLGRRRLFI